MKVVEQKIAQHFEKHTRSICELKISVLIIEDKKKFRQHSQNQVTCILKKKDTMYPENSKER